MQDLYPGATAMPDWLNTPTGHQLVSEELAQVRLALDAAFGDQFLQIGVWGGVSFDRYARTRRATVAAESLPADLITNPELLAIQTDSIDVAFLPHLLETHAHPHAVLREVDRVMRSDGHIILTGFNPISLWGLRHFVSRGKFPKGGHRMLTEHRVRDWLNLLDYSIKHAAVFNFHSPFFRKSAGAGKGAEISHDVSGERPLPDSRFRAFVQQCRNRSPFAGCYVLVAQKRMITMTPIRPVWVRRPRLVGGLVNPTTRNAA